jgi:hypothetical protein
MQSSSFSNGSHSSVTADDVDAEGYRQLNDEVLQSAENSFIVEAAAPASSGGTYPSASAGSARSTDVYRPASGRALSSYQKAVGQYVAAYPFQSAVMAAAAGALAAMLLRSKLRKRIGLRRWRQVR